MPSRGTFTLAAERPVNEWLVHIPQDIRARAYQSGSGLAWSRDDAIEVVEVLTKKHFVVIGVDIWLATNPGPGIPTPFVYDWSLEADHVSPMYAVGAIEFIRNFRWAAADSSHQGLEPYFNLTVVPVDA